MRSRVLAFAVAVLVLPVSILAATWTVKPDGTGDFPTIQAAVNAAAATNDLILLTDGTFSGPGNRAVDYLGKSVTIKGINGAAAVTIDCGGQNGFLFSHNENGGAVLREVTVTGAATAIVADHGTPNIYKCVIAASTTGLAAGTVGGPLASNPVVNLCTFTGCSTAMTTVEFFGSVVLNNSTVTNCGTGYIGTGGAIDALNDVFSSNGTAATWAVGYSSGGDFDTCTFTGHSGIAVNTGGALNINFWDCTFSSNARAIYNLAGRAYVLRGTFVGNTSTDGGAVKSEGVWLHVYDSVFCSNSASGVGGAIYATSSFEIKGNTFVRNASGAGGAIQVAGATATGPVQNNIVAFSTQGAGIMCASGANPAVSCNDIFGNAGGDGLCGTDGGKNFSLDPKLCSSTCNDLGLTSASPCAAANNACGVRIGARNVTCIPLPVLFQSATARATGDGVVVQWSVEADEAIAAYSVARAVGGVTMIVREGLGPSTRQFVDHDVEANTTYRYTLIASTAGGDTYQSQGIEVKTPLAPLELSQNQPNPFNPSTRIAYSLPAASVVDVAIFDVTGRRVATLVAGPRPGGRGSAVWQGRNDDGQPVASGIYVCRIVANGQARTVKMVLLK